MTIGPMRQRVTLQSLAESRDSYGQAVQSWADVGTYWAEVLTIGGGESQNAGQTTADATHTVRMRYNAARPINPAMRLSFEGRIFGLTQVKDPVDFRNRESRLYCREIVSTS